VTHPVLLPTAIKRLEEDERIERLVVMNTMPRAGSEASSQSCGAVGGAAAGRHHLPHLSRREHLVETGSG
jgi:hypothetical protein